MQITQKGLQKTESLIDSLFDKFSRMNTRRRAYFNQDPLNDSSQKSSVRSTETTPNVDVDATGDWTPMSEEGKFILLNVADSYLLQDFEYSLRLSTHNFTSICTDRLFEGNLLRFRSLASIELFAMSLQDEEEK